MTYFQRLCAKHGDPEDALDALDDLHEESDTVNQGQVNRDGGSDE